jgi:hypothetical protein
MTSSTPYGQTQATSATAASLDSLALLVVNPILEAQRAQWEVFASWLESLVALNEDLWEQWAVHFAGGVPIDG